MKLKNKNVYFIETFHLQWNGYALQEENIIYLVTLFHANFYLNNPTSVNIFPWLPRFSVSEKLQWLGLFFFFGNGMAHLSHCICETNISQKGPSSFI
jgi:hypothetical protein